MNKYLKQNSIQNDDNLYDALINLNKNKLKCLIVKNKSNKLLGTLTDGDVRRALISGISLKEKINKIYNKKPYYLYHGNFSQEDINKTFNKEKIDLLPIVDKKLKIIDIIDINASKNYFSNSKLKSNLSVVIVAGGKGTRLKPFTNVLPKPLIPINNSTLIELIIEKFQKSGLKKINIIVNYKRGIIKSFINNIEKNLEINFIDEKKPLGTIGGLSLLNFLDKTPILVTNCDVLIDIDYNKFIKSHIKHSNDVTMVTSKKEFTIPYGVCDIKSNNQLKSINEKPIYDFNINTGVYLINSEVVKLIPKNKFLDLNEFIEKLINKNFKVGTFEVNDKDWIDVGQWHEYTDAIEKLK